MDRRVLFVETLNDLEAKLREAPSHYTILRMSALLRQLLIDRGEPLVDLVRKGRRIQISYCIAIGGPYEDAVLALKPVFWAVGDGFYPEDALASKVVRRVQLPQLLSTRIMIIGGHAYTVKDVIRQLAHVEGGVHAGRPENDKERVLTVPPSRSRSADSRPRSSQCGRWVRSFARASNPSRSRLRQSFAQRALITKPLLDFTTCL
jgi:hypothetical protein